MQSYVLDIHSNTYTNANTFRVNYVIAIATATNISVILCDTAGAPFYAAESGVTDKKFFPACLNGHVVKGISVRDFDNCARVLVGVEQVKTD